MTAASEQSSRSLRLPPLRGMRGWDAAVGASVALLAVVVLAFGVGWLVSSDARSSTYTVAGPLSNVTLNADSGDVEIVSGTTPDLEVRRDDSFAFGRAPVERRSQSGDSLTIGTACPRIVVGSCSSSYRLAVPEDVSVTVRTRDGDVRLAGYRGMATIDTGAGNVDVEAYCGFGLTATSRSGNVRATTACAPKQLSLHSGSGSVTALVPPGRYRLRAASGSGRRQVTGISPAATAPFTIDASSATGDVSVEGGL